MAMLVLSLTLTPRRRLDIDVTPLYFLWNFTISLRNDVFTEKIMKPLLGSIEALVV